MLVVMIFNFFGLYLKAWWFLLELDKIKILVSLALSFNIYPSIYCRPGAVLGAGGAGVERVRQTALAPGEGKGGLGFRCRISGGAKNSTFRIAVLQRSIKKKIHGEQHIKV